MTPFLKASLFAIALLPAAAAAQTVNSAADIGGTFTANYYIAAGLTIPDRAAQRKQILKRLDEVCASKLRADQRRCDRAWRIIADGYAELQARRAAQAAASEGVAAP